MTPSLEPPVGGPPPARGVDVAVDTLLTGRARELGLRSATALVVGSIVGTGVFTMPAVMAGAGTSSILTLVAVAAGAVLLGALFGQLTKRVPHNEGGLYAYARHEFGDLAGFVTAWCYWITCWAGNAAIVSSWVFYVQELVGLDDPSAWVSFGIALTGLWIPAAVNLAGVRQMALVQGITVVLKLLPLLVVATVGWFFVTTSSFPAFNASGGSLYDAVNLAAGVALFSFIGVETASVAAARVKSPRRNVGRASVIGTGAAALLYVAVTAAVMGLVPHGELVDDGAPFVAAFETMFGGAGWVGKLVALTAVVSGLGALNGWAMVTAEMPWAAARDGLFPRAFATENSTGAPSVGIVVSTLVASALMAWSYSSEAGLEVFTYLVDLTVVTVAIPYFLSAMAQLAFLVSRRRVVAGAALVRDLAVAVVGGAFALWVTFASGYEAVSHALLLVLLGVPVYAVLKAHRERDGLIEEPVDLMPDPPADALVELPNDTGAWS
jgi:APA family basic amino acid/polyamine antiporter